MITIANANALHLPLPDQSVQCVVTSPPYYGLRDYGTAKWEGGSKECNHVPDVKPRTDRPRNGLSGGLDYMASKDPIYKDICSRCGARRIDAQIGLEPTPAAYVANIVAVMRECWRVLKDDGVLWLNIGDSYNNGAGANRDGEDKTKWSTLGGGKTTQQLSRRAGCAGLKPKDLIGIPWRVAFALQDDGWYLRQDIIWHKPNPMPESVTDRCTKAHEYIFLLSKSPRYFYDAEAIKEESSGLNGGGFSIKTAEARLNHGAMTLDRPIDNGFRNRRSVWTVATSPYSGAHFATFPPALIEPMILAGSRRGDVVLDPFAGSGTTGAVAVKHGRRAVLLDLNTKYIDLQFERTNGVQMQF